MKLRYLGVYAFALLMTTAFWACTENPTEPRATYLDDSTLADPHQFRLVEGTVLVKKGVRLEKGKALQKQSRTFPQKLIVYPDAKPYVKNARAPEEFIQDAAIVASKTGVATCPTDYQRLNIDLNQGSGGAFVYLCVTYDAIYRREGISRLDLYNSGSRSEFRDVFFANRTTTGDTTLKLYFSGFPWAQTHASSLQRATERISPSLMDDRPFGPYTYVSTTGSSNGDLNQDASGDFIWLAAKEGEPSIRNIAVIWGISSEITCPAGFEKLNTSLNGLSGDLNQNAGGYFIYLCQKF